MKRLLQVSVLVCVAVGGAAQEEWLPPEVEDGASRQLASRLSEAGMEPTGDDFLSGARQFVGIVRGVLESWGVSGVLDRAPRFPSFDVPSSGNVHLDAMGRYQVCNVLLMRQLADPDFAEDEDAKLASVTGLTSFTLAIVYLRHPFVASGGDVAAIEAHLTAPWLETILQQIQNDLELREHGATACTPTMIALTGAPSQ